MSPLKKFKILIADQDQQLASVSKQMLRGMGFSDISITPNGKTALDMIKHERFDFVITDWELKNLDGISLINHIRRDPDSPNPAMPVIMLTGRMEKSDVEAARDNGIHEYVVKPFSALTIFTRLERIVDFPRYFVVGGKFIGPDRRHKKTLLEEDRRSQPLLPQNKPDNVSAIIRADSPQLWFPDFTLKQKLGKNVSLESIITPSVLSQAQQAIDACTNKSLEWIKDDLMEVKSLFATLGKTENPEMVINEMKDIILMISSRGGTFGYAHASDVAYMLYLFLRNTMDIKNSHHLTVIDKHIQVLQFIFGTNIRNEEGNILGVIQELKNLVTKYS